MHDKEDNSNASRRLAVDQSQDLIQETHQTVIQIHTMLNMRGGVLDRLENLEREAEVSKNFRVATKTKLAFVAGIIGFLASFLKDIFPGLHK